ncbi:hypothetical protein A2U01_0023468, partial [Trifolium medium]|nr:hypothetical protein [Trifolium medium]
GRVLSFALRGLGLTGGLARAIGCFVRALFTAAATKGAMGVEPKSAKTPDKNKMETGI